MKKIMSFIALLLVMFLSNAGTVNNQSVGSQTIHEKYTSSDGYTLESNPEYPGGLDSMMNFLAENIDYPKDAAENHIEGRVLVGFVVRKNGTVTDVKVLRPFYRSLDEEAVRVVKLLKGFKPGKAHGEPVNVFLTLPVHFRLESNAQMLQYINQ